MFGLQRKQRIEEACKELEEALHKFGDMGPILAKHQLLMVEYYIDAKKQVNMSFLFALFSAAAGFLVLAPALAHALWAPPTSELRTVSSLGVISGTLIEFIAGGALVLHARGAKLFYAFHIC
jgi:hypothetical protein